VHLFLNDEKMDSQMLDSGPPQKLIDPPLVKANLVAQLADTWYRILRGQGHRSLGNVYGGMLG
jgi:hypothetical protein